MRYEGKPGDCDKQAIVIDLNRLLLIIWR